MQGGTESVNVPILQILKDDVVYWMGGRVRSRSLYSRQMSLKISANLEQSILNLSCF